MYNIFLRGIVRFHLGVNWISDLYDVIKTTTCKCNGCNYVLFFYAMQWTGFGSGSPKPVKHVQLSSLTSTGYSWKSVHQVTIEKMASSSTSVKQLHLHWQGSMGFFVILRQRYKFWNVCLLTINCYLHFTRSQHVS